MIALRTSTTWQVVTLIPEGSVSGIKPGGTVTISVPAAHIKDVPGQIDEIYRPRLLLRRAPSTRRW